MKPDNGQDPDGTEKGLRAMTMKLKLEVHGQIEQENARKLKEWKEGKTA